MTVAARLLFTAAVSYLSGDVVFHVAVRHVRNCAACRARR